MKDIGYAKRNKCHAQETMMKKESWTHEGPSIQKEREKDSPCPKKERERER